MAAFFIVGTSSRKPGPPYHMPIQRINIPHAKARGEWAELRFMTRAAELGIRVTKRICHPERARFLRERRIWARRAIILAFFARMLNRAFGALPLRPGTKLVNLRVFQIPPCAFSYSSAINNSPRALVWLAGRFSATLVRVRHLRL